MKELAVRIARARMSRQLRFTALLLLYTNVCALSLWLAYLLRFDFNLPTEIWAGFPRIAIGLVTLKLILLWWAGQFESLLTYFSLYDLRRIIVALLLSAAAALGVWFYGGVEYAPPRAVILADLLISFVALSMLRTSFRLLREEGFGQAGDNTPVRKHVGIIGAGDVGVALAKELAVRRGLGMQAVAFFDDDSSKWRRLINGVPVRGAPESIPDFLKQQPLDEVIIALPSSTGKRVREIVAILNGCGIKFETVPSMSQLITGQVRVSQIRPVEIQDLLGRSPVDLETDRIRELVRDRVVLVTGAGGTIGGELCRQIVSLAPRQLLLIERSEYLLFLIEQELRELGFDSEFVPLVADVLDPVRMQGIMSRFRPTVVFHAAAHKHVPLMEHQPAEAFRNNAIGTRLLAELSQQHGVERFILISSDKAINPTNVMGATKRIAELYLQALHKHDGGSTKFMAVRFGNVLGSSGSVIPTFKRQIAAGGPVTVTHPDVTRYFMTVSEAVGLVLQSATLGHGGEIFVLDMGTPIKIVDIARQLIELSGLQPDVDIEIRFTGLRPGEKLYEELNHSTENHSTTEHTKIMRFLGEPRDLAPLHLTLDRLHAQAPALSAEEVKLALKDMVPEYRPQLGAQ